MNTIKITKEDFKLIKAFYSDFTRMVNVQSNDFIIDWGSLMPVVQKIMDTEIPNGKYGNYVEFSITNHDNIGWIFWHENIPGDQNQAQSYPLGGSRINRVYKAVVEFIKWYNQQKH